MKTWTYPLSPPKVRAPDVWCISASSKWGSTSAVITRR